MTEETCGLRALVREAYGALGLQTYFTSGETETRAWTIRKGWTAPQAAGVIHSDFERCGAPPTRLNRESELFLSTTKILVHYIVYIQYLVV